MKYKISNTASVKDLEQYSNLKFKYPKVYFESPVISGNEESIVPIIVSPDAENLDFGIWGLLPQNYDEEWEIFQSVVDTLTTTPEKRCNNELFAKPKNLKRGIALITGFFTTNLVNGITQPYYVYKENREPMYVAMYYNKLNDGFYTFTLALEEAHPELKNVQNLSNYSPKILTESQKNEWLMEDAELFESNMEKEGQNHHPLQMHPIAKELYRLGIDYDGMLEPVGQSSNGELGE